MTRFSQNKLVLTAVGLTIAATLPMIADPFWLSQIITRALIMGIVAVSMSFLVTYLGVVSFAQVTLAGIAGYAIAYFGPNSAEGIGILLPWPATVALALMLAALSGAALGLICGRSVGIYAIMITLAVGMTFFFLTRQNYAIFNGWNGFAGLTAPRVGSIDLNTLKPFYWLSLSCATLVIIGVTLFSRSPLGLVIQGIRDNPERVAAIGIPVYPAIISAYAFSGLIAGMGGVLLVWYYGRVSSFSVGLGAILDILIIAVIGGLRIPAGAFLGALVFVLIDNFVIDLVSQDRFNTVIGLILLIIMVLSPDGLTGLVTKRLPTLRRWARAFNPSK